MADQLSVLNIGGHPKDAILRVSPRDGYYVGLLASQSSCRPAQAADLSVGSAWIIPLAQVHSANSLQSAEGGAPAMVHRRSMRGLLDAATINLHFCVGIGPLARAHGCRFRTVSTRWHPGQASIALPIP